jgi:hypothetical protein
VRSVRATPASRPRSGCGTGPRRSSRSIRWSWIVPRGPRVGFAAALVSPNPLVSVLPVFPSTPGGFFAGSSPASGRRA